MFSKIITIALFSIFLTNNFVSVAAQSSEDSLSKKEMEQVTKITGEVDINKRKEVINEELKKDNSEKYKKFISTKILIESERIIKNATNVNSKYESKTKNYSCWDGTGYEIGKALAGNWLYKFNLRINACADYNTVYSGSVRSTWAEVYAVGWSYVGETNDRKFDYLTSTEYIASRQGLFKLCVNSNWVCAQESRPWVEYHATREGYNDYWY